MKNTLIQAFVVLLLIIVMYIIFNLRGIEGVAIYAAACIIAELWQINGKL